MIIKQAISGRGRGAQAGFSLSNDMKQVTVQLNWKTGSLDRSREFTTYICRDGLQNYIY